MRAGISGIARAWHRRGAASRARNARSARARDSGGGECLRRRRWRCGAERLRAASSVIGTDLAIDVDGERLLQHAGGAANALIDGGIEVHERERRWKIGATRGAPVAREIDVADEAIGDGAQFGFQRGEVFGRDGDAALARVVGERDALVGGAAGIEGIIAPAAFQRRGRGRGLDRRFRDRSRHLRLRAPTACGCR